jgi:MOSC domain-containing protein YiiM
MAMRTLAELDVHLEHIRAAPRDAGTIELVQLRPAVGERSVVEQIELDPERGVVGDRWLISRSRHTPDGSPHPDQQLTLMSVRAVAAIAERERWPLAGDQLFVDLDLSQASLPIGAQLVVGEVLVEISTLPHLGCAKFSERFGSDATKWVNGDVGQALRLRGVNARIIRGGVVRRGDTLRRA